MRFQVTHKLTTYLLVAAAMATLVAANLLTPRAALLAVGASALSWFFNPGTRLATWMERATPFVRLAATAFFALTAYEVWSRLPEPDLTPVLNLVLFLVVYKLFQRQANRDYLQVYVLAFLMVLAGAAFAQSFLFAGAFVAYVVLTTWTLILLHLRREMEENYLIKHSGRAQSHKVGVARILNSRRVVGGPFLAATAAVALVVCVGAVATFALVPRVGAGFALGGQRARKTLIGFSDEVSLGSSGFLSAEDETVALRATLPRLTRLPSDRARELELDHFYWRGTVYETYQQGRWLRAHKEILRSQLEELGSGGAVLLREPHTQVRQDRFPPLAGADRQEIDIVGISAPVAFALDHPVAFEVPPPKVGAMPELRLVPRWSGEVALQSATPEGMADDAIGELHAFSGAHYIAFSRDPVTSGSARAGRPLAEIAPSLMAPYLELPPGLSPRVRELAQVITAGKATAAAKMVAVIGWLDATHQYSTTVGRRYGSSDPVENFLFEQKQGHCEYFASAAALLLRAAGVPTRYVNGFLGGEWNTVGKYVTVRQNRAHAWVEAYLGELGWMRVDATPAVRPPGRMGRFRQLIDSVEFFWGRWVVGYDLGRQIDLARDLGRGVGVQGKGSDGHGSGIPWRGLGMLAGALALGSVLWLLRRSRGSRPRGRAAPAPATHLAVVRLYRRCLDRLAERGFARRPAETPNELAARLQAIGVADAETFARLTELYVQARFGRKEVSDATVAELAKKLAHLGQAAPPAGARAA